MGMEAANAIEAGLFMEKMWRVKHMGVKKVFQKEVNEVEFIPSTQNSYFNLDGEIFDAEHIKVKKRPGLFRFLGRILN